MERVIAAQLSPFFIKLSTCHRHMKNRLHFAKGGVFFLQTRLVLMKVVNLALNGCSVQQTWLGRP